MPGSGVNTWQDDTYQVWMDNGTVYAGMVLPADVARGLRDQLNAVVRDPEPKPLGKVPGVKHK